MVCLAWPADLTLVVGAGRDDPPVEHVDGRFTGAGKPARSPGARLPDPKRPGSRCTRGCKGGGGYALEGVEPPRTGLPGAHGAKRCHGHVAAGR
jgi:hypothetical protein